MQGRAEKQESTMVSYRFLTGCGRMWWWEMFTESFTFLCKEDWSAVSEELFVRQAVDEMMGKWLRAL